MAMERKDFSDKVDFLADNNISHLEENPKLENEVVLKSSLDNLGLLATVKRFRKVRYYSDLASIS
jgi:hypothetical protein